jgi:hypothetical protein
VNLARRRRSACRARVSIAHPIHRINHRINHRLPLLLRRSEPTKTGSPVCNMLAASPLYYQDVYAPARPSPLSERPSNVPSRIFHFSMASQDRKCAPQRLYKPNPTIANRDVATQRRRDMFFRRVQNDRADKRWEARGDQVGNLCL